MTPNELAKLLKNAEHARVNAERDERRFRALERSLFTSKEGLEWIAGKMGRMNFMGSVFDAGDGLNAIAAAYRDGRRSVISEILNSINQPQTNEYDDNE